MPYSCGHRSSEPSHRQLDTNKVIDGMPRQRKQALSEVLISYPRVAPIAAFLLALLATLFVAISAERASRVQQRLAITERVSALGHDIERRAAATQAYLISGAALFGSGIEVDQATFDRFAAALQADKNDQGILALGWSVRLPAAEVAAFERAARAEGMPKYRAWPQVAGSSGSVDAIKYIAPLSAANRRALGYDMHSEPNRRAAMDRAALSGKPTITGIVHLVQDGAESARGGFLMYMPVFYSTPPGAARGRVKGYIYGVIRAEDFIIASFRHQAAGKLELEVFDEAETGSRLLYREGQPISGGQAVTRTISIADHQWIVKSSAAPIGVISKTGMLILLAGLTIASLLMFIVRLAIQQALFDRKQLRVRQEQDAIRATLTRELNHRVKNTLANVLSILSLSRRNAPDLDSFVNTFEGRVRALSATHNLLTETSWGPISVREVIQTELAPFFEPDQTRIALDGPDLVIAPNDALSLGLLIHELVTNAAKYGALSNGSGTLLLTWSLAGAEQILFEWRETGGPLLPANRQRGFGSDLIEKVISRELHSDIKLEFAPSGVRCTFMVPLRPASAFALKQNS